MANECRPNAAVAASRAPARRRRGLAAGWLLIWSPVFLLAIVLTVEVGNVLLAKVQLENALEAGALAAVKQWKANGELAAREYALGYAQANSVSGSPVMLDANGGGAAPNGNLDLDGDVVLGAVLTPPGAGDDCTQFIFAPNSSPSAGGTNLFASLSIRVQTNTDTKNDVQNGFFSFAIFDFSASDPSLEIAAVEFNVATVAMADEEPAFFDLRDPPSPTATGNDQNFGIAPIFMGTDVVTTSASPNFGSDTTSPTYKINFLGSGADAFQAGSPIGFPSADRFDFGVDTDRVGPDPGTGDNRFADDGGDFHNATVTVTFRLSGMIAGTLTGNLQFLNQETAVLNFVNQEIFTGNFGVRTKHTMTVTPICTNLFGLPLGSFSVCGEAYAACRGANGAPHLIRVVSVAP